MDVCGSPVIDRHTLEETVQLITPDFPYMANLCDLGGHPDHTCPWHWHEEVELFWVREGRLEYHLPSGCHVFEAGEGGFLNAGVLHMTRQGGTGPSIQEEVLFHPRFVGGEEDSLITRKYVRPLLDDPGLALLRLSPEAEGHREVLGLIRRSFEDYQRRAEGFELEVRELAVQIWRKLLALRGDVGWVRRPDHRTNSLRVKGMMEFIAGHYGGRVTLEQIAAAGCVSVRECGRCFQETLGTSPIQYLMDYRLRQACRLLDHTALSITEIAVSCGFGTSSYFGSAFRRRFGQTPRQYRARRGGRPDSGALLT